MGYFWTRLTGENISSLRQQYGELFPEFYAFKDEPFHENNAQILQLEKREWFRKRQSLPVFLSYAARDMEPFITLTVVDENDRMYFSEIDYSPHNTAKDFHRLLKRHGIRLKTCRDARFYQRKHPIPKQQLEERVKNLILKLVGLH